MKYTHTKYIYIYIVNNVTTVKYNEKFTTKNPETAQLNVYFSLSPLLLDEK